jgi:hypothetical protein
MAGQNLFGADDQDQTKIAGMPGAAEKFFGTMGKHMEKMVKASTIFEGNLKKAAEHWAKVTGNTGTGGKLGLGQFTRGQQVALGLGAVGLGGAALGMSMSPNTMSAVTQRMAADTVAGASGMSSQRLIRQANRQVGGGATSAMGPTMAQMQLTYQGGYLASSLSSKNVMGQLGGLSALTGGSNEQVAASLAGINGMNFIRMGVRARDAKGNLRSPNLIINDVYRSLYGNRKITTEQAAMVMNPGSKGYYTLMQAAGGDQALFNTLAQGIRARAQKGTSLTKGDLSDPNKSLDIMGVDKSSPFRSLFRYNSSEARKLQATEAGLVGGYNVGLRTTASVNDGFSTLAETLPGVTQALMTFKGALQTFPAAGNTGSTLAGLAGGATGMAMNVGSMMLAGRMLGMGGGAAGGGMSGLMGMLGLGGAAGKMKGATGALKGAGKFGRLGRVGLAAGTYMGAEKLQQWLNKKGKNLPGFVKWLGNMAFDVGQGGLTGLAAGGVPGAFAGMAAGGVGNIATGGVGGGDPTCNHGSMGCSHGVGGGDTTAKKTSSSVYQSPVPPGARITSGFGPRDNSRNPQISSNHTGVDYGVRVGTSVVAAADGEVTETGTHRQYGNYVIVSHPSTGKATMYAHLSFIGVRRGQKVLQGQEIGKSGGRKGAPGAGTSTGPHLHFEIRNKGSVGAQGRTNPLALIGKGWNFIKGAFNKGVNFIKRAVTGVKDFAYRATGRGEEPSAVTTSQLSSAQLSSILGGAFKSGGPLGWDDVKGGAGKRVGDAYINDSMDRVAGDSGQMTGGSRKGLMKMLHAQGFRGKALETAFAVALAESGGVNKGGDFGLQSDKWGPSWGAFQIRSLKNWKKYNDPYRDLTRLKNPQYNIEAAWHKSNQGTSWKAWSAYTNGAFTKYLDDARSTATAAGIGMGGGDGNGMAGTELTNNTQGSHSSTGSVHATSTQTINIDVDMNVTIARSSLAEAEHMMKAFKSKLEQELRVNGIGSR